MWQYNNELYHFGIKGQKWGIRRFQNPDGSLTEEGRRRKQSTQNDNSKKIRNVVVTAAVLTAAVAIGAHVYSKYANRNLEAIIPKGSPFQHMGRNDEDLSKPFWASYVKSDNKKYAKNDTFSGDLKWTTKKTLVSDTDIKIPSNKEAIRIFKKWLTTSKVAREDQYLQSKNVSGGDIRKLYKYFNGTVLYGYGKKERELASSFYSELKKHGYSAVRDVLDQEGYVKAVSPIIIFDNLDKIKMKDVTFL